MSSTIKRVTLDFQWPMVQVWKGFKNPYNKHIEECKVCDGSGYSPYGQSVKDKWYGYGGFHPEQVGSTPFLPTDELVLLQAKRQIYQDKSDISWDHDKPAFFEALQNEIRTYIRVFESTWNVTVDKDVMDVLAAENPFVMANALRLANHYNQSLSHHLNEEDVKALVDAGRLIDLTHNFVKGQGWTEKSPKVMPSVLAVNTQSLTGIGHDTMNQNIVNQSRCERAGEPMMCAVCDGDGSTELPVNEARR